ncbi:hypothetical protein HanIR_Chr02g0074201 [Helianthus annuus]|nr:hypothetical protein HanIR_Chr02g0074201 [Helianthus annuus]
MVRFGSVITYNRNHNRTLRLSKNHNRSVSVNAVTVNRLLRLMRFRFGYRSVIISVNYNWANKVGSWLKVKTFKYFTKDKYRLGHG